MYKMEISLEMLLDLGQLDTNFVILEFDLLYFTVSLLWD